MLKILLDTSFIIDSVKYRIDIEDKLKDLLLEPFELYIFENALKELEKKRLKNLVLKALKPNILKSKAYVDKDILDQEGYIVATNDKDLKRKLKSKNIRIISITNKSRYIIN